MAFTTPKGRTATSLSEINVTPLVDVMLVLLVIFMVTAPMLQTGIDVELPETKNVKEVNPEDLIIISISRKGEIYYGSNTIGFYSIAERLQKDAKSPKDAIFLRADKDVKWNSIISVIDAIKGAGFDQIKLVVKPFIEPKWNWATTRWVMSSNNTPHTFSYSGSVEENYRCSFIVSVCIHLAIFILVIFGQYFFPRKVVHIGSGMGGGKGGDIATIGVVDEFSGGAGMIKPSIVPKPPALTDDKPTPKQDKAIPLPRTIEPKKKKVQEILKAPKPTMDTSIIPTTGEKGSGGAGGISGGSGGGFGGGIGVSIGSGSGSFGDHWYAREVERRISSNWTRPPEGFRVDITFSFNIDAYGRIHDIKKEKTSGNPEMDYMAERAIRVIKDLTQPPPEFRGQLIQFSARFVYPPD
jgi:biopolymer transport protein TolR